MGQVHLYSRVKGYGAFDLVDVDFARLVRGSFGHGDAENAILERCFDIVLVDAGGEAERAVELAVRAFSHPVGRFIVGFGFGCDGVRGGCELLVALILIVILNSYFMSLCVSLTLIAICHFAVHAAAHNQGIWVRELDIDVFAVESGEFAVELISILNLADVKFWLEAVDRIAGLIGAVGVVVVKKTKDRREFASRKAGE